VYFLTDVALDEGAAIKFSVDFKSSPGGPITAECTARVVRVEAQGTKRGVAAAIKSFRFYSLTAKQPSE